MSKKIDHSKCKISSGIHDGVTFGRGELDYNGYWEFPCDVCARKWEADNLEGGEAWPFKKKDDKKEMFVTSWTKTTKYDCPRCGVKKTIQHPNYQCSNCQQKFKLKLKLI